MKKLKYGLLLASLLTISGCAGIEEVYEVGEFHTAEFSDNYYSYMPARYNEGTYVETIHDISDDIFLTGDAMLGAYENAFEPIIMGDYARGLISLEKIIELYGDQAAKAIKLEDFNGNEVQYVDAIMSALKNSRDATWFNYALHNSLSTGDFGESVNKAFKKGVFSKLTDTIIICDTTGSLVRVQINETGMGQTFEHELINYRNFVFSARGGTNLDYGAIGKARVESVKARINISFYIEQSSTESFARKETLTYVVDNLQSDNSMTVTVMSVDLASVLPVETLKRTSGMSITYELLEHELLKPASGEPTADGEFALMLYEVMFPYSTWR